MSFNESAERQAIKTVVDVFSNLADDKRVAEQMPLFTQDAAVNTYIGGELVFAMKGHGEISKVFTDYLAQFSKVYHLNGQQTVDFQSETEARAVSYCLVKLVGETDGKPGLLEHSVRYQDRFVKEADGQWRIAERTAEFLISETRTLA
ncbi:nuclear transport factor 2 family protein [Neisseria sp.]|uniref:nuclear transport factor 2 family protein n=1 Tax=Neisseria sp. TaxID=192066 RepID=UPI00359F3E74